MLVGADMGELGEILAAEGHPHHVRRDPLDAIDMQCRVTQRSGHDQLPNKSTNDKGRLT
ncbi:hypothetical protein GCM10010387_46170 [Streptomyces inusitatus]|uniref:Uncharacterized protein n=1 Tax=Streptomyces inusitatus TaxID=68221 RepID=A0A918UZ99_9ACTN|nr:hypothetical protein GCM10010387_46170 [Streptomyces inusitatus]